VYIQPALPQLMMDEAVHNKYTPTRNSLLEIHYKYPKLWAMGREMFTP